MSSSSDNLTMLNFETNQQNTNDSSLNLDLHQRTSTELMGIIVPVDDNHHHNSNTDRSEDGSDSGLGSELILEEHEITITGSTNVMTSPSPNSSTSSNEMIDDLLNEVGEQQQQHNNKKVVDIMEVPLLDGGTPNNVIRKQQQQQKQSILKSTNRNRKRKLSLSTSTMMEDDVTAEDDDEQPLSKKKRHVSFSDITVFYFPRMQGFTCVPSKGGSTLGMAPHHHQMKTFSLSEHAIEQKKLHRLQILQQQMENGQQQQPDGSLSPAIMEITSDDTTAPPSSGMSSEDDFTVQNQVDDCDPDDSGVAVGEDSSDETATSEESEIEDLDENCYYFLQPVSIKQRRALLRASGIRKIDSYEKAECETIRTSREFCGCACKGYCDPDSCSCSQAGIKCQVDRSNFPCGCTSRDNCGNTSGRIEFNPIGVRTHFIHTLMRLDLEKKQNDEEEDDGRNERMLRRRDRHQRQLRFGAVQEDGVVQQQQQQQFLTNDDGWLHSSSTTTSLGSNDLPPTSSSSSSREDSMDLLSFRENYYCQGDVATADGKLYTSSVSRYPEFHLAFPLSKSLMESNSIGSGTATSSSFPLATTTSTATYISTPSNQYARIQHHHQQQQQHAVGNIEVGLFGSGASNGGGGFSNNFFHSSFSEIYESFQQQRNTAPLLIQPTATSGGCVDNHFPTTAAVSTGATPISMNNSQPPAYTSFPFEENHPFTKNIFASNGGDTPTLSTPPTTTNNNNSNNSSKLKSFCDLLKNNGYHYIDYDGSNDGALVNNYSINTFDEAEEEARKEDDSNSLILNGANNLRGTDGDENFGEIIKKSIVETDGFCIN